MAVSSLALKRLLSSGVLSRSLRSARTVSQPASSRLFNTTTATSTAAIAGAPRSVSSLHSPVCLIHSQQGATCPKY